MSKHTEQASKRTALERMGFVVGLRDPNMNTRFSGAYMVSEPYPDGYSQPDGMGGDGVWCIVGDDLEFLVNEAASFFADHEGFVL